MGLFGALEQTSHEYLDFWIDYFKKVMAPFKKGEPVFNGALSLKQIRGKLLRNLKAYDIGALSWITSQKKLSEWVQLAEFPDFQEVCTGLSYAISSNLNSNPELSELLHLFSLCQTGRSVDGGLTGYRELLLHHARTLGVHIPEKLDGFQVFVEKGAFTGIHLSTRGHIIQSQLGIVGCSLPRVYDRITYNSKDWLQRKRPSSVSKGWRFTIALNISENVIPHQMTSRAVWQEKNAPPLEFEVSSPQVYGLHQPGRRLVS